MAHGLQALKLCLFEDAGGFGGVTGFYKSVVGLFVGCRVRVPAEHYKEVLGGPVWFQVPGHIMVA